jgi:hypothetical protein
MHLKYSESVLFSIKIKCINHNSKTTNHYETGKVSNVIRNNPALC